MKLANYLLVFIFLSFTLHHLSENPTGFLDLEKRVLEKLL